MERDALTASAIAATRTTRSTMTRRGDAGDDNGNDIGDEGWTSRSAREDEGAAPATAADRPSRCGREIPSDPSSELGDGSASDERRRRP